MLEYLHFSSFKSDGDCCCRKKYQEIEREGVVNEDLASSWECPRCLNECHKEECQARLPKAMKKLKQDSEGGERRAMKEKVKRKRRDMNEDRGAENDEVSDVEDDTEAALRGRCGSMGSQQSDLSLDMECTVEVDSMQEDIHVAGIALASPSKSVAIQSSTSERVSHTANTRSPAYTVSLFEKFSNPTAFLTSAHSTPPCPIPTGLPQPGPSPNLVRQREPVLETMETMRLSALENTAKSTPVIPILRLDLSKCKFTPNRRCGDNSGESSRESSLSSRQQTPLGKGSESATSDEENQQHGDRGCSQRSRSSDSASSDSVVTQQAACHQSSGSQNRGRTCSRQWSLRADSSDSQSSSPDSQVRRSLREESRTSYKPYSDSDSQSSVPYVTRQSLRGSDSPSGHQATAYRWRDDSTDSQASGPVVKVRILF